MASTSGGLASMGCSLPYAIAAKFAFPGRPTIACSGDGAMQMGGNNELITVAHYWREWADPRFVVVVLKNNDLNFVTWEMRREGEARYAKSQDVPQFDYVNYASSLGLGAYCINSPDDVAPVLQQAFSERRPVLIQVNADPAIPPLPPHLELESAQKLLASVAQGDQDDFRAAWGAIQQFWQTMVAR